MSCSKYLIQELVSICKDKRQDAALYLAKARKLSKFYGPGLAVTYCWFYSVPQRWMQIEPKIFDIASHTNSCDLEFVIRMTAEELAALLWPIIFSSKISIELANFFRLVKDHYGSWLDFTSALKKEDIFSLFRVLRCRSNTRLTFKNLSAMKSFIGAEDDLPILDTHLAKVLGISAQRRNLYVTKEPLFRNLLKWTDELTQTLRKEGVHDVTTIEWTLSTWFSKTGTLSARELLTDMQSC